MDRLCPKCRLLTDEVLCPADGYKTVLASSYQETSTDPLVGTEFDGRYRIERRLGVGGMGAVYVATQLVVDRQVAIKILHASFAKRLKEVTRFQQEARAIASLKHPNTIRLIDFGQSDDGFLYLVMEYLEGEDLADLLAREAPLQTERIVRIALEVFGALSEAHDKGIVHRDLKPANLFLTHIIGQGETVKVLDFGIAKVTGDMAPDTRLTREGAAIGSPRFMAPEQARAQEVKPATDVYAMGCILYLMLTGRQVFRGTSPSDLIIAHVKEDPPWPQIGTARAQGPLVDFILQCLQKRKEDRPEDGSAAVALLRGLAEPWVTLVDGPDQAHSDPSRPRARRRRTDSGVFPSIPRPPRSDRGIGPLSTGHLVASDDPTGPARTAGTTVWWSLTGIMFLVALIGLGFLLRPEPPAAAEGIFTDGRTRTQARAAKVKKRAAPKARMGSSTAPSGATKARSSHKEDAKIRVLLVSTPPGAQVWQGEQLLGNTPHTWVTPRGEQRIFLRFKLDGHRVSNASLVPRVDVDLKVPMAPL